MGAQISKTCVGPLGADRIRQFGRSDARESAQVGDLTAELVILPPKPLARPGVWIGEAGDMEGERPAILSRQMRETLHGRAFESLIDDLVECEDTAFACARAIRKVDRGRVQSLRGRPSAIALRPVTARAILAVEVRTAREIGRCLGRQRHRVGGEQGPCQPARGDAHCPRLGPGPHRRGQFVSLGDQPCARGMRGKPSEAVAHLCSEFEHFSIFGLVRDPAASDRAAIVDRHVIEQPPDRFRRGASRMPRRLGGNKRGQQDGSELNKAQCNAHHILIRLCTKARLAEAKPGVR